MRVKLKFDDLSPEEQNLYLRAAQHLLDEDEDDDGPCEVCRMPAPEHRMWCPLADDAEPLAA